MSRRLENIFAHAIALNANTRLKNEIHCVGSHVYVVNYDRTVILRFDLTKSESFDEPLAFYATDYDSPKFYQKDGKIFFEKKSGDYVRTKSCKIPNAGEAASLFDKYYADRGKQQIIASLSSQFLNVLDKDAGHIEFSYKNGATRFIQRDLFSGSISTIDIVNSKGFAIVSEQTIIRHFDPIAMRTNDFYALFSFCDKINFLLDKRGFFIVEGNVYGMKGIVAGCLYDDIGRINNLPAVFREGAETSSYLTANPDSTRSVEKALEALKEIEEEDKNLPIEPESIVTEETVASSEKEISSDDSEIPIEAILLDLREALVEEKLFVQSDEPLPLTTIVEEEPAHVEGENVDGREITQREHSIENSYQAIDGGEAGETQKLRRGRFLQREEIAIN